MHDTQNFVLVYLHDAQNFSPIPEHKRSQGGLAPR